MISIKKLNEKWENFVNDFIFANYKSLEIWYAKREVSQDDMIFNYIRFPKAENGKSLSTYVIQDMIDNVEADENLCKLFFGPAYIKGSYEIQNDVDDISIIWNKLSVDDMMDFDLKNPKEIEYIKSMYRWNI